MNENSRININITTSDIAELLQSEDETIVFNWTPRDQFGNEVLVTIIRNDNALD